MTLDFLRGKSASIVKEAKEETEEDEKKTGEEKKNTFSRKARERREGPLADIFSPVHLCIQDEALFLLFFTAYLVREV